MKRIIQTALSLTLVLFLAGCTTAYQSLSNDTMAVVPRSESIEKSRMLIWRAWLSLEVASVSNAVASATEIAKQSKGYIESNSSSDDESAQLTLRVPAVSLVATMSSLESIGKVTNRRVSSKDVSQVSCVDYFEQASRMSALLYFPKHKLQTSLPRLS